MSRLSAALLLALIAAPPVLASAKVENSLAWEGFGEKQASQVTHGLAYVSRDAAGRGEYEVIVLVADRPFDRIAAADEPGQAFRALRYGHDGGETPTWIQLEFDDQGGYPQAEYGGPNGSGSLWDSQFSLTLEHADATRVAGVLEITDPDASAQGRLRFDVPIVGSEGIDPDLLQRPARYQAQAPAATAAARATYEGFVRDLRAGNVSGAREVVRGDLDRDLTELELARANSRPEAPSLLQAQIALWPDRVHASQLRFSYDADGQPDVDAPNAKLAVCGKAADGTPLRIVVDMWKFGADDHWWIVGRSNDDADMRRFPSAPGSCAR